MDPLINYTGLYHGLTVLLLALLVLVAAHLTLTGLVRRRHVEQIVPAVGAVLAFAVTIPALIELSWDLAIVPVAVIVGVYVSIARGAHRARAHDQRET